MYLATAVTPIMDEVSLWGSVKLSMDAYNLSKVIGTMRLGLNEPKYCKAKLTS
jgi:hypothetical protein